MSRSLLDPNAKGGGVARKGFAYQDAFVLQHLPSWLAQSGFSHVVSESIGDVEVCYFCPQGGFRRRAYEAKNHALTEANFWNEVCDFHSMHMGAPDEYVAFCLVCGGFKPPVVPLLNKLERLRGVGASYPRNSPVTAQTREEIVDWVVGRGQSRELGEFIVDRVDFVTFDAANADSCFAGEMCNAFPDLDLSTRKLDVLRSQYASLVSASACGPLWRADLESGLMWALGGSSEEWLRKPTHVCVEEGLSRIEELSLDISGFVGRERAARTSDDWGRLQAQSERIAEFIKTSRSGLVVEIDAKLRMSLACLLGYVFSATRGFTLSLKHNGIAYNTYNHTAKGGRFFIETVVDGAPPKAVGAVCIGFPTAVGADLDRSALGEMLPLPRLNLESCLPISDMATLNLAVNEAKASIVRFRSEQKLQMMHLFVKAPSFFASTLGHRLNGVCAVQLYDWVEGEYVQTVVLR